MRSFYRTLFVPFFMMTLTLKAQDKPLTVGIKGGLNLAALAIRNPDVPHPSAKPGFNLGVTTSILIGKNTFLQSGLAVTQKGTKRSGTGPLGFPDRQVYAGRDALLTSNQFYAQVPVYVGYRIGLTPTTKLLLSAGPYAAYGFGGKTKLTGDIIYGDMIDYSTLEQKTFGDYGLKRWDVGAGTGVAVDWAQTRLGFTFEWGFRDIRPTTEAFMPFYAGSYRNRNLSLWLEYKF